MNETNRIEYKLEYNSDIDVEKEVIAFLNYKEGGYVYFGIDKDGDVIPKFYRQTANLAIFNNDKRRTVSHSNRQLITFRTKRET